MEQEIYQFGAKRYTTDTQELYFKYFQKQSGATLLDGVGNFAENLININFTQGFYWMIKKIWLGITLPPNFVNVDARLYVLHPNANQSFQPESETASANSVDQAVIAFHEVQYGSFVGSGGNSLHSGVIEFNYEPRGVLFLKDTLFRVRGVCNFQISPEGITDARLPIYTFIIGYIPIREF